MSGQKKRKMRKGHIPRHHANSVLERSAQELMQEGLEEIGRNGNLDLGDSPLMALVGGEKVEEDSGQFDAYVFLCTTSPGNTMANQGRN